MLMPRVRINNAASPQIDLRPGIALDDIAPRPKPKTAQVSKRSRDRFITETEARMVAGSWDGAKAGHIVALYAIMHAKVYGVGPAELDDGKAYLHACARVTHVIEREFSGSIECMIGFMRWSWRREMEREKWRRDQGRDGGRIQWRWQFGPQMLTDYRIARARQNGT